MDVSLVISVYNEEENIEPLLTEIVAALNGLMCMFCAQPPSVRDKKAGFSARRLQQVQELIIPV